MKYKDGVFMQSDRGEPKYSERNLSHFYSVHHRSCTDWPGIKHRPLWWITVTLFTLFKLTVVTYCWDKLGSLHGLQNKQLIKF